MIKYVGSKYLVQGRQIPPSLNETLPLIHDPVSLVAAMQFVRDRTDSLCFLPPDLRTERFTEGARKLDLSLDQVLRLSSWFPAVEAQLTQ